MIRGETLGQINIPLVNFPTNDDAETVRLSKSFTGFPKAQISLANDHSQTTGVSLFERPSARIIPAQCRDHQFSQHKAQLQVSRLSIRKLLFTTLRHGRLRTMASTPFFLSIEYRSREQLRAVGDQPFASRFLTRRSAWWTCHHN